MSKVLKWILYHRAWIVGFSGCCRDRSGDFWRSWSRVLHDETGLSDDGTIPLFATSILVG